MENATPLCCDVHVPARRRPRVRSSSHAWNLVIGTNGIIKRAVKSALHRGTRSDFDEAFDEAEDIAYERALSHKGTQEMYERNLSYTLKRRFGVLKRSVDAADYKVMGSDDLEHFRETRSSMLVVVEERKGDTLKALQSRIDRLPSMRYRHIAQMKFIKRHRISTIVRRTGRTRLDVERTVKFLKRALSVDPSTRYD